MSDDDTSPGGTGDTEDSEYRGYNFSAELVRQGYCVDGAAESPRVYLRPSESIPLDTAAEFGLAVRCVVGLPDDCEYGAVVLFDGAGLLLGPRFPNRWVIGE